MNQFTRQRQTTQAMDIHWPPSPAEYSDEAVATLAQAIETMLMGRPTPIRRYDQIHMRLEDLARHVLDIAPALEGRAVVFVGDSDGIMIGLKCAAGLLLAPSPGRMMLCDFDRRLLRFVETVSRHFDFDNVETRLYNVFDPFPEDLVGWGDVFHTNPPFGRYNGGRSILAFIERGIAATRDGGHGVVILANDVKYVWTQTVLAAVVEDLSGRGISPTRIVEARHRYVLDDVPDLASGTMFCNGIRPDLAFDARDRLPKEWARRFYGRETIDIPQYIDLFGDVQLSLIP